MPEISLTIENEGVVYLPLVQEGITLEWTRQDAPGKLSFNLLNDGKINFQEGNPVRFAVDGINLFLGYVFTKNRDKEQVISVTAYDQLRYLKNKDSLKYTGITADSVIKSLADDTGLTCGALADTKVKLSRREDSKTYFDMIKEALGETLRIGKEMYVLYDDFGKLTLKNIGDMALDCLVSGDTAENFSYETSIDGETYNKVKLFYNNEDAGTRDIYEVLDSGNIAKWGLLQLYEEIKDPAAAIAKAEGLLKLYNSKRRKLSVSGVLGDTRVRAGCQVPVSLTLGDINANTFLMVETVKHTFQNGSHTMDLELRGGMIV